MQIALLRNEKTPEQRAREFTKNFSGEFLREILPQSRWKTLMQTTDSSTNCSSLTTEGTTTEETKLENPNEDEILVAVLVCCFCSGCTGEFSVR